MRLKCTLSTNALWIPGSSYQGMEAVSRNHSIMVCDEKCKIMNWFSQPYRHDSMGTHYQVQLLGEYGRKTLAQFVIDPEAGFN